MLKKLDFPLRFLLNPYLRLKCPFRKLPPYICRKMKINPDSEGEKRKINLTFGVFGVIPSYLVSMEHILFTKYEKIIFDEKIIFRSTKSKF